MHTQQRPQQAIPDASHLKRGVPLLIGSLKATWHLLRMEYPSQRGRATSPETQERPRSPGHTSAVSEARFYWSEFSPRWHQEGTACSSNLPTRWQHWRGGGKEKKENLNNYRQGAVSLIGRKVKRLTKRKRQKWILQPMLVFDQWWCSVENPRHGWKNLVNGSPTQMGTT